MAIPKDYLVKCKKNLYWCVKNVVEQLKKMMSFPILVKFNCGKPIVPLCYNEQKEIEDKCKRDYPKDKVKAEGCFSTNLIFRTMPGCGGGADKRAGKIGDDKSAGVELYLGIGALLLILIVGAIATYFYLFGGKKDGKTAKGARKSKSKMAGKSKIGSRKSQASKRSSRKGSQRSKVSGASKGKGTKSRMSSKKK